MNQLETEIHDQVTAARAALEQARAADDDYLAGIHEAELTSLARTASNHGMHVDLTELDLTALDDESRTAC